MIKFADRMNLLTGSEIRELLKLAARPEVISFAGGMPAMELFPVEEMKQASIKVMDTMGRAAMQYSSTEGYPKLREQICERMLKKQGIKTTPDNILITSGSQVGLDFSARVFLNKGDTVMMEAPSYLGAVNAMKACEPKFVSIPTDNEGMLIPELRKAIEENPNVKYIYVIPDFQNPSGKCWSLERRKQFMEVVNEFEIPVVEDNPYGELRFEGEPQPTLKSLDTKGLVVYLGTMSKILAPGYRLGWVCAESNILEQYNHMAQAANLQASTIAQMECAQFLEDNDLDEHIAKLLPVYDKRRKCMLKTLEENLPEGCTYTKNEGGLFTWVELPKHINAKELQMRTLKDDVAFVPGGGFFPNGGQENYFRLNYSAMDEEKIEKGIKIICECIKEFI